MKNADFAALWASGHGGECTGGTKRFRHSLVGALTINFQVWLQADTPDHRLEIYTPTDKPIADALALLTILTHENPRSFAERSGRNYAPQRRRITRPRQAENARVFDLGKDTLQVLTH